MTLVDTHVHFNFPEFDEDRNEAIQRARAEGIQFFVNIGTDLATSRDGLKLTERYEGFYCSAGIHPHEAARFSAEDLPAWEDLARHEKTVAIGYRNLSPREDQERVFRMACGLARKINLPLILHVRDAFPEALVILRDEFPKGLRGVFHCFSGDVSAMRDGVELGLHISFAGPVTYKKNDALREVARQTPRERIVVETDAPFLPPQSRRGKRNESALMTETVRCIAEVRQISLEEFSSQTTDNARTLFGLGC